MFDDISSVNPALNYYYIYLQDRGLNDLPHELLLRIMSHTSDPFETIRSLSRVNKRFDDLCKDPSWKTQTRVTIKVNRQFFTQNNF